MNRSELLRLMVQHQAMANACEQALKDEARLNFAQHGAADTWRMPGTGTLSVSLSHDKATVVDNKVFLDWLARAYPTEVEVVTQPQVRNPGWLTKLLTELQAVDPEELKPGEATSCMDAEGSIIPGLEWRKGGSLVSVSITPDGALKRAAAKQAKEYVTPDAPPAAAA